MPIHVQEKMTGENSELCAHFSLYVEHSSSALLNGCLFCARLVLAPGQRIERAKKLVCWINSKASMAEVVSAGEERKEMRLET